MGFDYPPRPPLPPPPHPRNAWGHIALVVRAAELEPHPLDRWGYLVTVPQATTDSTVELELVELLFQVTVQIFEVFTFIPKQRIHFSY